MEEINRGWGLQNESVKGDGNLSWGREEENNLLFFEAATVVKLKILRHLQRPIRLCKIHSNGQVAGQPSGIHTDFDFEGYWTFVLFCHPEWNVQWGGEFMCFNPETQSYAYAPPLPNTGVLIPAHWDHVGHSPNHQTSKMRTSLAFSYAAEEIWDQTLERYPYLLGFS
jgi:hypothetical protein